MRQVESMRILTSRTTLIQKTALIVDSSSLHILKNILILSVLYVKDCKLRAKVIIPDPFKMRSVTPIQTSDFFPPYLGATADIEASIDCNF